MSVITRIEVPVPVKAGLVNAYYIHDSNPTIIDPGVDSQEALAALAKGIEQQGGSLSEIRRVLLTHGHMDHSGLAGRFAAENGASIHVHALDRVSAWGVDRDNFNGITESYRNFFTECGAPTEIYRTAVQVLLERCRKYLYPVRDENYIRHGDTITCDDLELQVVHAPGHSAGSVCFLDRDSEALYPGDSLFPEMTCNPLTEEIDSDRKQSCSPSADFMTALDRLEDLKVTRVFPGHGKPYSQYAQWIQNLRKTHEDRLGTAQEIVRQRAEEPGNGTVTAYDIGRIIFPTYSGLDTFIAISAGKQYLDRLCRETLVEMVSSHIKQEYRWSG